MPYVPEKGDFVIVTFDPRAGHEQKGRRPALVVSNTLFNRHTGLAIACPVTHTFRNIPFARGDSRRVLPDGVRHGRTGQIRGLHGTEGDVRRKGARLPAR